MLFEVLYPFVLDGEVKHPHMFVDIDDYETGMRLLAAGAVVEVQEQPADRIYLAASPITVISPTLLPLLR